MSEDTSIYSQPEKPGLFRRLWRFIKTTIVVLVILIALSYLPASLLGDPGSRLRQAHDITLDTRELSYSLISDAASGLQTGAEELYQSYDDQLPAAVTDWLDPWLAEEAAEPMPASTPAEPSTPSQESMPAEPASAMPAPAPESEPEPESGAQQ